MIGTPGVKHLAPSRRFPKGGWEVRYRDDQDMTRRRTFPTKEAALDYQAKVRVLKREGDFFDPRRGRTSFRVIAEEWFGGIPADKKPKTRQGYRYILDAHVLPALGDKPVHAITPAVLRGFLAKLDRAPSTKRNVFRTISPIMALAVEDGYIRTDPCRTKTVRDSVPRVARSSNGLRVLTPDQVASLADAVGPAYRTLVYFAAYTGCRAGEIVALRVRHLALMDLNRSKVSVVESISEVKGELHTVRPKSGQGRGFRIPRFLAEMLVEATAGKGPDEYVFPGVHGGPLRHSHFYARTFRPAVRKTLPADLQAFRFHDLRHTAASLLIANGENFKAISERLGHSSIAITVDRYGHLYDGHDDGMMDRLEALFSNAASAKPEPEAEVVSIR